MQQHTADLLTQPCRTTKLSSPRAFPHLHPQLSESKAPDRIVYKQLRGSGGDGYNFTITNVQPGPPTPFNVTVQNTFVPDFSIDVATNITQASSAFPCNNATEPPLSPHVVRGQELRSSWISFPSQAARISATHQYCSARKLTPHGRLPADMFNTYIGHASYAQLDSSSSPPAPARSWQRTTWVT